MSPHDQPCSSYPPPPLTASKTYFVAKVKEILHTNDLTEFTKLVTKLCYGKETDDSSKHLYDSFKHHFPNLIAVYLLRVYTSTPLHNAKIRSHSLSLLDSLLIDLEDNRMFLKESTVKNIKARLNTCLLLQETSDHDFKLLSRIISRVAVDVFLENMPWYELCSYTISLQDNKKMLLIFSGLPMVLDEEFLIPLLDNNLYGKIRKGLVDPDCDNEEWCLAFEAGFNLMLHLINVQGNHITYDMFYTLVDSAWKMVNVRKREVVVRRGLIRLARIVRREAVRFRDSEYELVSRIAWSMKRINGVKKETEMAAEKIYQVLGSNYMEGKPLDWNFIQTHVAIR